jgi:hypothetical protein
LGSIDAKKYLMEIENKLNNLKNNKWKSIKNIHSFALLHFLLYNAIGDGKEEFNFLNKLPIIANQSKDWDAKSQI